MKSTHYRREGPGVHYDKGYPREEKREFEPNGACTETFGIRNGGTCKATDMRLKWEADAMLDHGLARPWVGCLILWLPRGIV